MIAASSPAASRSPQALHRVSCPLSKVVSQIARSMVRDRLLGRLCDRATSGSSEGDCRAGVGAVIAFVAFAIARLVAAGRLLSANALVHIEPGRFANAIVRPDAWRSAHGQSVRTHGLG